MYFIHMLGMNYNKVCISYLYTVCSFDFLSVFAEIMSLNECEDNEELDSKLFFVFYLKMNLFIFIQFLSLCKLLFISASF